MVVVMICCSTGVVRIKPFAALTDMYSITQKYVNMHNV